MNDLPPVDVLIVGAGMFVCGRGTPGYGTILPAIVQLKRDGIVGRIQVAASRAGSVRTLRGKLEELNRCLGTDLAVEAVPVEGTDPRAYLRLLEKLPDRSCVIVAVPDHLHSEIGSEVLRRGRDLLMVKPLAPTADECQRLIDLAREHGCHAVVEYHKRWDWANLKLKEAYQRSQLGTWLYGIVEYSQRRTIPLKVFGEWTQRTNIFHYLGVHYVDIIYFATGAQPLRVLATGQRTWLAQHGLDTYDAIQAIVEWKMPGSDTSFVLTLLTSWVDPDTTTAVSYQAIKVIGTEGRFESDQKDRGLRVITASGVADINPYFHQSYPVPGSASREFRGYGIESVQQFVKDVRLIRAGKARPSDLAATRPTFSQALTASAVAEAVTTSLEQGSSWVPVRPAPAVP